MAYELDDPYRVKKSTMSWVHSHACACTHTHTHTSFTSYPAVRLALLRLSENTCGHFEGNKNSRYIKM